MKIDSDDEVMQNAAHGRVFCYRHIVRKIEHGERLSTEDARLLFKCNDLDILAIMANIRRRQINGDRVFFNQNFHIEPSNVCMHRCKFCSFRRNHIQDEGAWVWSMEEIITYAREKYHPAITEVHITGSVHPDRDLFFYTDLIARLRAALPSQVSIKAFSATEIEMMCKKAGERIQDGLALLKEKGLDALPGGGAEIFDPKVRAQICPEKTDGDTWLAIHDTAHRLGLSSNATMLFGHIETIDHQIDHLDRIRNQQDKSGGFTAFVPLKFRSTHNEMSYLREVNMMQTFRLFAVSRLFLDNIPHIKAYWPMLGKEATQMALLFGVDDVDGTIQKSTKIYSMAGAEEQNPHFNRDELCSLIRSAGYLPVERDSFYRECENDA